MEGEDSKFSVSMSILGKRLEVMRRKNEMSLMQNEILSLESELRQLEMQSEQLHDKERTKETDRQRRVLPDIPPGRREHVTIREPPELHLYDDSSISGTDVGRSSGIMQGGSLDFNSGPMTSTPSAAVTKSSEPLIPTPKSHDKSGVKIKPATYDGTVNWTDFKAHFDACAEINGWTDKEKGLYLAVSLRGQAQGVFGNLSSKSNDYKELSNALQERFAPPNQTELYRVQLKERKQKATESLSELGQDVWRLTNLAYPTAPADLRETLAKEKFIDALVSSDMRLRIKQARPTSLNTAIRHAVELEAFNKAERKHLEGQGFMRAARQQAQIDPDRQDELAVLKNTMYKMQTTLDSLTGHRNTNDKSQSPQAFKQSNKQNDSSHDQQKTRYKRRCWICGSEEHFRRDCPKTGKKDSSESADHQMKQVASFGSGLYLNCKVNGIPVESLIDTGATLTIISIRLWDQIKQCRSSRLEQYDTQVFTASRESVEIKGKTTVFIDIGRMQYTCQVVVADTDVELIMGLDFLKTNECQIDVVQNILSIHGESFELLCNGKLGCNRISVSEKVNIPDLSEMTNEGKIEDGQRPICAKDFVFSIYRSTMVNEKKTPRKHQWCNNCRKMVLSELFTSRQVICARKRKACTECGATFSKMCYLIRHRKNFHAYQPEFIKPSKADKALNKAVMPVTPTKKVALPSDMDIKETWDKDPEIELGETNENELLKGRVFRKNVCPNPVFAPKKRKVETVSRAPDTSDSENESIDKSVRVDIDNSPTGIIQDNKETNLIVDIDQEDSVKEKTDTVTGQELGTNDKELEIDLPSQQQDNQFLGQEVPVLQEFRQKESECQDMDTKGYLEQKDNKMFVQVEVKKEKHVSQNIILTDNGETLFSNYYMNRSGEPKSEPPLNLGDYLPRGILLKPGDITLRRKFTANGVIISMDIDYRQ